MNRTKIEWCDVVWNPTSGCTKISVGCKNCYAERMAKRLAGRFGYPEDGAFKVVLHPERLREPLKWRQPKRVFVNSMGDLFHPEIPRSYLIEVFSVMEEAWWHTFLVLTKRPIYARRFLADFGNGKSDWPLKNVWIGVSIENQAAADERIPILLEITAVLRFVNCEPLLGPIDLSKWLKEAWFCERHGQLCDEGVRWANGHLVCKYCKRMVERLRLLDWVIAGGETGPNARPAHPDWVRQIRDQCEEAKIPFFLKHLGEWAAVERDQIPRKRKNDCVLLNVDGRWRFLEDDAFAEEPGTVYMYRIGKKLVGRALDGREWNEYPRMYQYRAIGSLGRWRNKND